MLKDSLFELVKQARDAADRLQGIGACGEGLSALALEKQGDDLNKVINKVVKDAAKEQNWQVE